MGCMNVQRQRETLSEQAGFCQDACMEGHLHIVVDVLFVYDLRPHGVTIVGNVSHARHLAMLNEEMTAVAIAGLGLKVAMGNGFGQCEKMVVGIVYLGCEVFQLGKDLQPIVE